MVHKINEEYRVWEAVKSVLSNRGLWINAKKCQHDTVIVPMASYRPEALGMSFSLV